MMTADLRLKWAKWLPNASLSSEEPDRDDVFGLASSHYPIHSRRRTERTVFALKAVQNQRVKPGRNSMSVTTACFRAGRPTRR